MRRRRRPLRLLRQRPSQMIHRGDSLQLHQKEQLLQVGTSKTRNQGIFRL